MGFDRSAVEAPASRPPMGWNSWDCYGTTVTEEEVLANARFLADHLADVGWDTVVVDIAWYDPNAHAHGYSDGSGLILDDYGRQLPDPARFPSSAGGRGFTELARAVHDLGLRFGLHLMRGIPRDAVRRDLPVLGTAWTASDIADTDSVCAWNDDNYGLNFTHPGAQAWLDSHIDLVASWGVDFLKVDDMLAPFHADAIEALHAAVARAEAQYRRPITVSLSPGTMLTPTRRHQLDGRAHMWRICDDVWDRWEDIDAQFPRLARWARHQRPGAWADADMLPLGHIGIRAERGADRQSLLTIDEQRTMLTLWAMARSPLFVGGDLPTSDPATIALLRHPMLEVVTAYGRDPQEILTEPVGGDGRVIVWRTLLDAEDIRSAGVRCGESSGDDSPVVCAAVFSTASTSQTMRIALGSLIADLDIDAPRWHIRDLWDVDAHDLTIADDRGTPWLTVGVPAHGVRWFTLTPMTSTDTDPSFIDAHPSSPNTREETHRCTLEHDTATGLPQASSPQR